MDSLVTLEETPPFFLQWSAIRRAPNPGWGGPMEHGAGLSPTPPEPLVCPPLLRFPNLRNETWTTCLLAHIWPREHPSSPQVFPQWSPEYLTPCARTGPLYMFFSPSRMPLACSPLFPTPILKAVPPRNLVKTSSHSGSPYISRSKMWFVIELHREC